jgi:cell shape-determining protein MreD
MRPLLAALWHNQYSRTALLLMLCYVIFNAFGGFLNKFDYVIILYIFILPKITEETALKYALVFGIFYDLNYQIFIGLGILLFQLLNLLKIYAYQMVDMAKAYSRFLYSIGIVALYLLLTVKFSGYPPETYWHSFAYFALLNLSAGTIISAFIGGARVLSPS